MYKRVNTLFVVVIHFIRVAYGVIVNTNGGLIEGRYVEYDGVGYHSFQGIRYAQPPTGNLRFKPPIAVTPWTGVADARRHGAPCPQAAGSYSYAQMSEDCLYLNVYAPLDSVAAPVLFWVHGGEFNALSANEDVYGPQLLMPHGIILVTANYRLGALGFLSLNTENASGNAGLKDVTIALEWVKRNIANFGGDPNSITLAGNSAGAAIAHYLMLTTKTDNLFHRVILHSGSAIGYRFLARDPLSNAFALAKHFGIDTTNTSSLLEKLMEVDPIKIVKATTAMGVSDDRKGFRPFAPFVPSVEIHSPHAFITEEPLKIMKAGIPQNYPVLAGFNEDEGIKMLPAINSNANLIDQLNENFERCIPTDIEYSAGSEDSVNLAQKIKDFYFNNDNITDDNKDKFVELITDTQFSHSIDWWIRIHKNISNSESVYYYKFKYDGELNWFKIRNGINYPGTAHGDDIGYLFYTTDSEPYIQDVNRTTRQMLDNMLQTTTNFVKFGQVPSSIEINIRTRLTFFHRADSWMRIYKMYLDLNDVTGLAISSPTPTIGVNLGVSWEQCSLPQGNYLQLEPTLHNSAQPPIRNRTLFWEEIYLDYYNRVTRH